jgi:uncharacterized repeat protein (TIGR03803 family)
MKPELIPSSTVMQSAKETCMQWRPWAMAFAILLGLAAVPPSAHGQTFTVLHSFKGGTDGESPVGGVVRDAAGNLYGTTASGGGVTCFFRDGCGTVFKVNTTGKETVLYSFTGGADGAIPLAGLIRDAAGNLYGTTEYGGDLACNSSGVGCGTVFKVDTTGKETVLYSFTPGADGAAKPFAGVIRDAAGNLYGTTAYGGPSSSGTVFKVDTNGKETVLYTFTGGRGGTDGYLPGGVIGDAAGNLYGTTYLGGDFYGTVFKLDSTGKETVYRFRGGTNGEYPVGDLILDKAGNLYGTTENGGTSGFGTVFKLNTNGKKTVLYSFTGGADGNLPTAGVIADAAGNLYGTTQYGGVFFNGTVFKLDKTGKETVLYSFTDGADGAAPGASLVRDAAGNLYGTAIVSGDSGSLCTIVYGCGVVFKIAP